MRPGRNDTCPCGSGKKFKKCCALHESPRFPGRTALPEVAPAEMEHLARLLGAGRHREAENAARELLRRSPGAGVVWQVLGSSLWMQGKDALAALEMAAQLLPDDPVAHDNLGSVLRAKKRPNEAALSFRRALALRPTFAEAHSNLGGALRDLAHLDEAAASYRRALAIDPRSAVAHSNLGDALLALGQVDAAIASCRRALEQNPQLVEAHNNLALAMLLAGEFDEGWREYEWRLRVQDGAGVRERRQFRQPRWCASDSIAGQTILIYSEQGLGDTLQFCRYVPKVAALGASVVFEVQAPLVGLLEGLTGVSRIIARDDALPDFDCRCPLLSLPMMFETRVDSIPSAAKYLSVRHAKTAQWRARLGDGGRPRVGLAWSGNADHRNDQFRSIPLALLVESLPEGFDYCCLQKDLRPADEACLRAAGRIRHFDDDRDFEATAALCECMDLVISVDTSVAHLSGALGITTWVLLPSAPDWRWLLRREDSPWYPSVRLYRQERLGDWRGTLERIRADLARVTVARA